MPSENHSAAAESGKSRGVSGKTLGRYRLEKKLGEGGMGAVYRAVDDQLNRVVALKVLPKDKARNELMVKRFKSEARAAANLKHDNIVGVYDSGEADGYLYIAMEFVDGIDVYELLTRKGVLTPKRSLDIVRQVTLALQHAYEQNIVHRDIKPANLLIMRDGSIKLADMGLARSLSDGETSGITRAGTTVGTVDYMSPEQARDSRSANCLSDIYSLGATWFYMLTGRPPFPDGDILNKITAHATQPRPDIQKIDPEIPDAIGPVIEKMMAIEPEERYLTPAALLQELETVNLNARPITNDLLAALADGDTEVPAGRNPVPSKSSRKGSKSPAAAQNRPARTGSSPASRQSGSVRREPAAGSPKVSRPARPSDPEAAAAVSGKTEDRGSARSAIPSARDAMLGGQRLRPSSRQNGSVEFSPFRLVAVVVGIVAVCLIGSLVLSRFREATSDPATPQSVPDTSALPVVTPTGYVLSGETRPDCPAHAVSHG